MPVKFDIRKILDQKKYLMVLFAVVVVAGILIFDFGGKSEKPPTNTQTMSARQMEQDLENILSQVKGAGKVSVMIVLRDSGQNQYQQDEKTVQKGGETNREEKTILPQGSGSEPLLVRTTLPSVNGVIVVAQGAHDSSVKEELKKAVQAALPVMAHRVEVLEKE